MIHVGVLDKGIFRDFSGLCSSPEESLEEYISGNTEYGYKEILYFDDEHDKKFLEKVSISGSSISEEKILYFMEKLKEKEN